VEECPFCKILNGEAPAYKVYEDGLCIGILDTNPACPGQTILLTKRHAPSYIFLQNEADYLKFLVSCRNAGKLLEKKLHAPKVQLGVFGTSVDHLHAKLFPTGERVTKDGRAATAAELEGMQRKIA
jgi:histidine triad (HIT) family protein